jgi:hypothetical protein
MASVAHLVCGVNDENPQKSVYQRPMFTLFTLDRTDKERDNQPDSDSFPD